MAKKTSVLIPWPKHDPALTLRCVNCSSFFDVFSGDEKLVATQLCPECFVDSNYPYISSVTDKASSLLPYISCGLVAVAIIYALVK